MEINTNYPYPDQFNVALVSKTPRTNTYIQMKEKCVIKYIDLSARDRKKALQDGVRPEDWPLTVSNRRAPSGKGKSS